MGDGDGEDTNDLQGRDLAALGISDFAGLESVMSTGPNVEISFLGGDSITLLGVAAADPGAGEFPI
jgi:hypothetical protein